MDDTQWPRFQVFVQEEPEGPLADAGSVHAPDAELALMNARDVFARRPACTSMWVVPVESIFSKTVEELLGLATPSMTYPHPGQQPEIRDTYYVSCKLKHSGTQIILSSVDATNPDQAMQQAIEKYSPGITPLVWWVFPTQHVTKSDPADIASLYAPARDKGFRMSTDFHTVSAMKRIKTGEERG